MEVEEFDRIKLMYDNVYDELNRSRDWPIKIMAFASAIDIAIYGLLKFDGSSNLCSFIKIILAVIVFAITQWTVMNIYNQHLRYKEYFVIRIKLQNKLGIQEWNVSDDPIFDNSWSDPVAFASKEKSRKKKLGLGWHFYVAYIISLGVLAVILIFMQ